MGAGRTRVVYDLGDGRVMKIAKSKNGIVCNRTEVTMYRSSLKSIKTYLAEIFDYDKSYHWLTMKKYDRKFPNSPKYSRKLMILVKLFRLNGMIPSKGVGRYDKPYRPNLRIKRNRQIVVIDYGGFKYSRRKNNAEI